MGPPGCPELDGGNNFKIAGAQDKLEANLAAYLRASPEIDSRTAHAEC